MSVQPDDDESSWRFELIQHNRQALRVEMVGAMTFDDFCYLLIYVAPFRQSGLRSTTDCQRQATSKPRMKPSALPEETETGVHACTHANHFNTLLGNPLSRIPVNLNMM